MKIPRFLRYWFVIHFIADLIFAIPLLLIPEPFLGFFGWQKADPFTARLVAAALLGIGIESYLGRNAGFETFRAMLNLKVIWSGFAIIGIILSMIQAESSPPFAWLVLGIFVVFNVVWVYYRFQLRIPEAHPNSY